MDIVLSPVEVRVLGSLVEKELTTPEYYPLSLIALVAACNQKSNRDPVMTLTGDDVALAIESLRGKNLAWQLNAAGGRVPKFEHNLPARLKVLSEAAMAEKIQNSTAAEVTNVSEVMDASEEQPNARAVEFNLLRKEIAVLCVLMLRGPLTIGEVRGCTGRMYQFKDLADVEDCVTRLSTAGFIQKLARQPGTKESRFHHCFFAAPAVSASSAPQAAPPDAAAPAAAQPVVLPGTVADRVMLLEQKVAQLTNDVSGIRQAFEEFRKKFE
jgi:hypothetical protein